MFSWTFFGRTCSLQISRQMLIIIILSVSSVFNLLKHVPACVEQVSINTYPTDVFAEEVKVPVAQVAFLNLVVLFLFYNFYVCFNLNYIVVIH